MLDITKIMDQINKDLGSTQIVRASKAYGMGYRRLSSGILAIDLIAGGLSSDEWGFPTGRIIELWGESGSGKTTVALSTIAQAQEQGFCGAFINLEGAWDQYWAECLGVDLSKMILCRVATAEQAESVLYALIQSMQAESVLYALIQSPDVGVVVMDSLAMLTTLSELETDTTKKNVQPGTQAKATNRLVRHVSAAFNAWPINDTETKDKQPVVIFLNQIRERIGGYGDPSYSPGGKGKDHQSSIRVRLTKGEIHRKVKTDSKSSAYAITIKARTNKNKTWPPFQSIEFLLYIRNVVRGGIQYSTAEVDENDTLLTLGMHYELVERKGSIYEYSDVSAKGAEAFKAALVENENTRDQLYNEILEEAWKKQGL